MIHIYKIDKTKVRFGGIRIISSQGSVYKVFKTRHSVFQQNCPHDDFIAERKQLKHKC